VPQEPVAHARQVAAITPGGESYALRLRRVPLAEARLILAGRPTPAMRAHWHPEYPQSDSLDGLAMLTAASAAMAGELDTEPRTKSDRPTVPTQEGLVRRNKPVASARAPQAFRRAATAWWIYQVLVDDEVVGDIGFHGPPDPAGSVEIGYNVVPAWQGRGVATWACGAILQQAWRDGAVQVIAETEPGNVASQTVLARNGFQLGADQVWRVDRPES
jgi:RimJ/RimL family protein N-acetyltransferase